MRLLVSSLWGAALLSAASNVSAGPPLAYVAYDHAPATRVRDQPAGTEPTEVRFNTFAIKATAPLRLGTGKRDPVFLPALQYRLIFPRETLGPGRDNADEYHELGLSLTWLQPLSDDWNLLLLATPSLAGAFSPIDTEHFRIAGGALGLVKLSPKVNLGFGLVASYSFGELLPVPAFTLDWRPNDNARVDLFLPSFASIVWTPGDRFELGPRAQLDGNRFTMPSENDSQGANSVSYSVIDAGLQAALRVGGPMWLTTYAGYVVVRRFEIFDDRDKRVADLSTEPGPVFRVGLELRPPAQEPAQDP